MSMTSATIILSSVFECENKQDKCNATQLDEFASGCCSSLRTGTVQPLGIGRGGIYNHILVINNIRNK